MQTHTYRARSLQEALDLVRRDLGPDAAVLRTREVRSGLWGFLTRSRMIEVTASDSIAVPSRLPKRTREVAAQPGSAMPTYRAPANELNDVELSFSREATQIDPSSLSASGGIVPSRDRFATKRSAAATRPVHLDADYRERYRQACREMGVDLRSHDGASESLVESLSQSSHRAAPSGMPDALFRVFTDLIEADFDEQLVRTLLDEVRRQLPADDLNDAGRVRAKLQRLIENDVRTSGPIETTPGERRIVALVGPTGVGKTTTIAKLAANYQLRQHLRVGLITVDTYRIAAVEQLRTYADIIDLPMEVVATPREMRSAVARMADLDLILLDTAGRSPCDEVRIQELKSLLAEACVHECHLVVSATSGSRSLTATVEKFASAGVTSLILTKLDESAGLGNLLPMLRKTGLPVSYCTNGQNVPDDITVAERRELARWMLTNNLSKPGISGRSWTNHSDAA